jgi:oligoendopeptidase F
MDMEGCKDLFRSTVQGFGGVIQTTYEFMVDYELWDTEASSSKFPASYTTYLDSYEMPFFSVNPSGGLSDYMTLCHEFGHFVDGYVNCGGSSSIDCAEIFSQGLEYLSLCYTEDSGNLEKIRMATCLTTYVEQAAFASFERQVYGLTGDQLTVENIQALYESIGIAYGFDSWGWDSRDYVCTSHFFTSPMYVVSYVVSNDAALQLYQMEKMEQGTGLACYTENLTTMQPYFLAFLEEAGLKSPFAPGRLEEVRKTLETVLG